MPMKPASPEGMPSPKFKHNSWADGVYFQPRMEEKQCFLVLIGADDHYINLIVAKGLGSGI